MKDITRFIKYLAKLPGIRLKILMNHFRKPSTWYTIILAIFVFELIYNYGKYQTIRSSPLSIAFYVGGWLLITLYKEWIAGHWKNR